MNWSKISYLYHLIIKKTHLKKGHTIQRVPSISVCDMSLSIQIPRKTKVDNLNFRISPGCAKVLKSTIWLTEPQILEILPSDATTLNIWSRNMTSMKQKAAKSPSRHYSVPAITAPSVGTVMTLNESGACPFWGSTTNMFTPARSARNVFKLSFVLQFEQKMAAHIHIFTAGMLYLRFWHVILLPVYVPENGSD